MKAVVISLVAFFVVACSSSNSNFRLDGAITDAVDGEMICLSYPVKCGDIWYEQRDTTYINSGSFRFEGNVDGLVSAHLSFPNMDCEELFIEPARMKFSAARNTMYDYTLSGLSIDEELKEYRNAFAEYNRAIYEKNYQTLRKNEECMAANEIGTANAREIWAEFYELVTEFHAIKETWSVKAVKYIETHPDQAIVPYLIERLIFSGYDADYDMLVSRLSEKQRNTILAELMMMRKSIAELNIGRVGSRALDFDLNDVSGEPVCLSKCLAKGYVLLDFWASWCRPCIGEIPKLRALHNSCGDNLQIISLSVDQDEAKWREAVTCHNLTEWSQLIVERPSDADEYYFSEQADLSLAYGVDQIPCFILVDDSGAIVGRWTHLTADVVEEIKSIVCD